ncbi:GNAT family N-acetyltransferase [Siminovitchia acidinfaciens]|nr:GNAT family N-acetyltransferase [Siminovitchia acidinfaciens]
MTQFEIINNPSTWNVKLKNFRGIDCYYSYEYGNLFAKKENGRLFSAYFENNQTKIFYPFIKRIVPFGNGDLYDIVTPYGYGGPFIEGCEESITEFYKYFSDYCEMNHIITETIRFHPLYNNHRWFRNIIDVEYIKQTTAADLTISLEEIRQNYSNMNKRNIRKAIKNNISCFVAENNLENISKFVQMYNETMIKNNAADYYFFDENYFIEQMQDTNLGKTYLLFAKYNNDIIAGTIVIVGQEFSHYHLGASKSSFLALKPNNLMFDFMIEFSKSKGVKLLHLGGGYEENDGLFKFKSAFTNNNNFEYYIGKKVHNTREYNKITNDLNKLYDVQENYFPIYRGKIKKKQFV